MTNMFTNYDNQSNKTQCKPHFHYEPKKGTKLITNIKGEVLGVQVIHSEPLQLYFHLENFSEIDTNEALNAILQGVTLFEILTTTGKNIVTWEYSTVDILDQYTNDLCIALPQEEMKKLKKETYAMRLTLKAADFEYQVFAEKDGYLVVR